MHLQSTCIKFLDYLCTNVQYDQESTAEEENQAKKYLEATLQLIFSIKKIFLWLQCDHRKSTSEVTNQVLKTYNLHTQYFELTTAHAPGKLH